MYRRRIIDKSFMNDAIEVGKIFARKWLVGFGECDATQDFERVHNTLLVVRSPVEQVDRVQQPGSEQQKRWHERRRGRSAQVVQRDALILTHLFIRNSHVIKCSKPTKY